MDACYSIRDIRCSDPFVLADEKTKTYYIYARYFRCGDIFTGEEPCFYAIASHDLIHWTAPQKVFERGDFWADLDYWAPECHIWHGKYYLFSTFRAEGTYRHCQALVADNPLGPLQPVGAGPVTPEGWQCLDGTLYVDRKGKPWMVFCHEWLQVFDGQVAAIPLSDDLSEAVGDPIILFRGSSAPWRASISHNDHSDCNVTDGPFLHRLSDGTLIMLWSSYCKHGYATGIAKSLSGEIRGPWIQESEPLYAMDGAHSMLFRSFSGQLVMALHCPNINSEKRILLFTMEERDGTLHILNELTGNWYNHAGGQAKRYLFKTPCKEPCQGV